MKKLLLHIPHAAVNIPTYEGFISDKEAINEEIKLLTDWYTDELFESSVDIKCIAPFSRVFCDVERFPDDADEVMSKVGMGALYEKFDNGQPMRQVTSSFRHHILLNYYHVHHQQFQKLVEQQLDRQGICLILDCHSYPSKPLVRDLDQTANRPDFNIGIDSYHTPHLFIEISKVYFEQAGYSLGINWPYSGAIVPLVFYKKNKAVQSIMLEINRNLYLHEPGIEKSNRFKEIQAVVQGYMELLRHAIST
ncbi:MAG: N-formylglutamate amidohydrolase [Flavobacterium sp.]|nr:N-formylglutamate amidohydrolase [Flavobacterium sp.]